MSPLERSFTLPYFHTSLANPGKDHYHTYRTKGYRNLEEAYVLNVACTENWTRTK